MQMEKRKRNGLEVTCIGVLYQGPWEKKYWSSSRGKDRFPYPVGYQAVRCYNGHSYHMEVQEGARGPLFVVAFGEGMKCSAGTPTIVWQDAMKKTSLPSKQTRGRLLSSDINGSELFGFLDPLVQRLFRELILAHEGEAQPDNNIACVINKADDVMKQKATIAGCFEESSWNSTRTVQVRKSRTSIVCSGTKGSGLPGESSTKQLCCTKGHRKRLKLVKPPKQSEAELSVPCERPLPRILSPKSMQPGEGYIEGDIKIVPVQEDLCGSMKVPFQEIPKRELLKGTVIPDTFDDTPSQIYSGEGRVQANSCSPMKSLNDNKKEQLTQTSGHLDSIPVVISSEPRDLEDPLSFMHRTRINLSQNDTSNFKQQNWGLIPPIKTVPDVLLNNLVVPDSCDIKSQDLKEVPPEVQLKYMIVPDSFDVESSNELRSVTQGAVEQVSVLVDSSDKMSSHSAKEESQSNEENTEKGESDSLGQELTKSMITLLLPQALQIYNKRKRKKLISSVVNEFEKVDLPCGVSELGPVDEKGDFFNSNEVKKQVLDAQSPQNEVKGGFFAAGGIVCIGANENQKASQSNKLLNEDNRCHNCHEACVETSQKIRQLSDETTTFDQQSNNANDCGVLYANDIQIHQHQKDSSQQPTGCTINACEKPVLADSASKAFLDKEQLYNASDKKDVSSSSIVLSSLFPNEDERSLPDQNCVETTKTEAICSPLSNLLNFAEGIKTDVEKGTSPLKVSNSSDHFAEGIQTEVEKGTLPSKVSNSSEHFAEGIQTEVEKGTSPLKMSNSLAHLLEFHARESESNPVAGQELSAVSLAFLDNKVQPNHSDIPTGVMGPLACQGMSDLYAQQRSTDASRESALNPVTGQELSAVSLASLDDKMHPIHSAIPTGVMGPLACQGMSDFFVHQRSTEASELEAKVCSPQSETFVPKVCLEHPVPILAMKIRVQDDQVRLLICCGGEQDTRRLLLVYQLAGKELLPSIICSTAFDIMDRNSNVVFGGLVHSNGIHFTPDGQKLLLLGLFKIRETTEETQASPLDQENCPCGIQFVEYTFGKFHVASRLSSSGSQLYCVLPVDTCTVIAGGESRVVIGWVMDASWRSHKEIFTLPLPTDERDSSSCISQLSGVSNLPSIIVGCDDQGTLAIWNFVSRQLLKILKLSMGLPTELHILKMDVVVHGDCAESTVSRMLDLTECRSSVTEKVAALLLVSTLTSQGPLQSSAGQSESRNWSLKILRRDCSSAVFSLDQLHQRISTMEVSERLGLAGTNDGCVLLWDTWTGSVMETLRQSKDEPVRCIAIDQACKIISVAGGTHAQIYAKQMKSQLRADLDPCQQNPRL